MSIVLLRTLTKKSVIGFGDHKDVTVQNLLDMCMYAKLLEIYFYFRNIDFTQDIKDELCIEQEMIINKKDKNQPRFDSMSQLYIGRCLYNIKQSKSKEQQFVEFKVQKHSNYDAIKVEKRRNYSLMSKGRQQRINQGNYSR